MYEYLATASSLCYLCCNIPLAFKSYKARKVELPWFFILLVLCGQVLACSSILLSGHNLGLLLNYIPGVVIFSVFTYYKITHNEPKPK